MPRNALMVTPYDHHTGANKQADPTPFLPFASPLSVRRLPPATATTMMTTSQQQRQNTQMAAASRDPITTPRTTSSSSSSSSNSHARRRRLTCLDCCCLVVMLLFLSDPVRAFFFSFPSPSPSSTRLPQLQPSRPVASRRTAPSMLLRRWIGSSPSPDPATPASSSSSSLSSSTPPTTDPSNLKYDGKHNGKEVTFKASKSAECEVVEGMRSIKDYMALPPSQYSVLDADAIVRLGEDSFRCQIGSLSFFGYQMTPILYVKVNVDPVLGKSTLNIYKLELTGSRIAEIANGTFQVKARNVVSYRNTDVPANKILQSTVSVQVDAQVPRGNMIPLHVLESGGSLVIKGVLKVMVPRFVKILAKDYENWSTGDDSRGAVAQDMEDKLTAPKV